MRKKLGILVLLCMTFMACMAMETFAQSVLVGAKTTIDASSTSNGYFDVKTNGPTDKKIKVVVEKGGQKMTYDLPLNGTAVSYPLQLGDGVYNVKVIENVESNKYSLIQTCDLDVKLTDQFAPFLNANVYVNFKQDSNIVKIAQQVTAGCATDLEKLDKVYSYVADLLTYDSDKAATVQPGYIPQIDSVLASKKGICYDYAAVMAAMLRSQNIPTKLVTGYVSPNNTYHAWNEVYIKDVGWVKTGEMSFDGTTWKLLDPTFLSSSNKSEAIQKFIGDGSHYSRKSDF